ncbi:MAG: AAA family ATPase [Methanosarcinaceae archaeon]
MITSFSIKNFKSYRDAKMHFAPLTLFIGANASGKSNALEAIRLLSWMAGGGRLDDIERGMKEVDPFVRGQPLDLFRNTKKGFEIGCQIDGIEEDWDRLSLEISLIKDHLIITGESVSKDSESLPLYTVDSKPNAHTDEIRVKYNNFSKGKNKPHIPCSNKQAIFYQLETPARFAKSHEKSQKIIPSVVKGIRETLRNVVFLDPRPAEMRDYSYAKDDKMKEDGSNLSSVIYKIWNGDPADKGKLLEFVRSLPEQDIKDISFIETGRNDVMVRLVESFGNADNEVDAPMLSDGTLRVLAVGATLLSAPRGSLVIIEEIDNGVHPSRADSLIRQIRKISEERGLRVLLTSHNPALLDALPDDSLGDVLCCYRDPEEGDSRIVRLSDLDRYPELVAQGSLGQLMTKNVLDRYIKDKTTSEERKSEALSWLNELKKEVPE